MNEDNSSGKKNNEAEKLRKELEAVKKELRDFAYIVSHDLKAPLRAINQLANWIHDDYADSFDEDGKEQMQFLMKRVKRLDILIDGILLYSRAGREMEAKKNVDVAEMVNKIIKKLPPDKNVEVSVSGPLPTVFAEPVKITQIFENLIDNAITFMDKPSGKVKITCQDKGDFWEFSVSDNGPGIDPKYHEKIFNIFQTLQSRDEHESSGVGLSVVKKIIEFYGGQVRIESKAGSGTSVLFTFPKKET
ncbi:MAG: GHKL domain-containing protein [Candidatus Aminicenantes bacterium]|nr:GHKL domain-containing protein [Candidatus Aminicenantes bacterium]